MVETAQQSIQLGNADRLLAQIVKSSDDAIVSKTLDGIITSWNAAAERIFGFTAAEAIGQHISIIFPPDRIGEEDEIVRRLKAGEEINHYETVRRHKNGFDIPVSLSVAPIRDGDDRIIGASKIVRDITERKQAEIRSSALQNELAHVGRLSAMGQMSAAIAHELNQPLTAVTNYMKAAHRLLEGESPSARQIQAARDAVDKAAAQTIRAGKIIHYLRGFAEKRESEKVPEDINAVIREAVVLGSIDARSNKVEVILKLEPGILIVEMDKVQLQQVLLNLIRNAAEAMDQSKMRKLVISSCRRDTHVEINLRDTGPGLPAEVRAKLFQPFVTTKFSGMGIGLKICKSIVEAHDGNIQALADNLPGAAFQIHLPLVQNSLAASL